jgi:hypothetical protein
MALRSGPSALIAFLAHLAYAHPALCAGGTPVSLGMRGHYGFLWGHRSSSWILVERHSAAWELYAERAVNGERAWHHSYLLPVHGIAILYTDLGSPSRIGSAMRVLPYLHLPLVRRPDASFGLRAGWGIGLVTRPFDRIDNGKQIAIGSRVNTAIQVMAEYRRTQGRWTLSLGLGLDHWSNGAYRLPNLGLNYVSTSFGVGCRLGSEVPQPVLRTPPDTTDEQGEWRILAAVGVNEADAPYSGQRSVYVLQGLRQWKVSPRSGFSAGADVFNKGTLAVMHPELAGRGRASLTQLGLHGGYTLFFGRGELFVQLGGYVHTPAPDRQALYQRIGVRIGSGRHLLWNMSLKSHSAVADHWEFGVGYRWN